MTREERDEKSSFVIFLAYNFYPKRLNCPLVATSIRSSSSINCNNGHAPFLGSSESVSDSLQIVIIPSTGLSSLQEPSSRAIHGFRFLDTVQE